MERIIRRIAIITIILLTGLLSAIGSSCIQNVNDGTDDANWDELEMNSFREKRTITVAWKGSGKAEEYILYRAQDEVNGIGEYEEIYRGKGRNYSDKDVKDDIRYVYRVDMIKDGNEHRGEHTGIGVGSNAEIDFNEPNNRKEDAAALGALKSGAMYYFRFSDMRELSDIDWYRVKVGGNKTVYVQIQEDGAAKMTTLMMSIEGKEAFFVEQGKWYELQNKEKTANELYVEIKADKESYVETGMTGGTIRGYKIVCSDKPEPFTPPGNNGNGNGSGGGNLGGINPPVDPGDGIIEQKSELFNTDGSDRLLFLLNDTKYRDSGYTFWKYLENDWDAEQGIEMELVKESGNYLGGYGFFFAGGPVEGYGESMLVLLLQKDGNYTIGKAVEGKYQEVIGWRSSLYLRKGYGVKNTVSIRWDNENLQYIIAINGLVEMKFVDAHAPVCNGNRSGVVAVVTGMEEFPQTPVKVFYTSRQK